MQKYRVELIGKNDLLMHKDNIDWAERVRKWQTDPRNKGKSVPGDDRYPGWVWIGCLYHHGGLVVIDSDNIMSMLRDGGKKIKVGKTKASLKAVTQSGIICNEIGWPLMLGPERKTINARELLEMVEVDAFDDHADAAAEAGFELFVKRARIGQKKHVRVRPRFADWRAAGTLTVTDESLTKDVLQQILDMAGNLCGIGDWRPGAPTPGQFGTFTVTIDAI